MSLSSQRLAAADEANLVLDHAGQVNVFLVAGLLDPGGFVGADGDPDLGALRAAVRERLAGLPQLRQVLTGRGFRHRWAAAQPDLEQHVRLGPAVHGLPGLEILCGDLMGTPLLRGLPLWELLVMPDAGSRRVWIVLRIHHAVADGIQAVAIAGQLFDPPAPAAAPAASEPRPRDPQRRHPLATLRTFLFGLHRTRLTLTASGVGATVLLGPRSANRGVAFVDIDLAALEANTRPRGATLNDALLASVAAGYRAALPAAGEPLPARLPVSIPVALQRRGTSGNQVGVMLVQLPLQVPDADDRLRLIAEQSRAEKGRARQQGTLELMRGPVGASIMNRLAQRQHLVAGFVTNVPGPPARLHLAGAPVAAIWPVAVIAANVRLGVAAISYAGRLSCSVHFDARYVPGAVFAGAMADELARLSA
ncbi:wax ester/triacylglycerol synthase domain-containing protein [Cryobacterium sp.]|uniref:wax ester/triacylglycerol synthase domain-containing protein n=1 Tax=Cryobacterium sp. TaxID=1926290 RepID=UPI0026269073|nr:wax ester/triacylglycerol synthase domain-containing protein [Cryobacterium sp.]MCU1447507.1 acyltransferase [Cryobacterium sp.]